MVKQGSILMLFSLPHPRKHIHTGGFTLVEMLITITIAAILAAIAIPSYRSFILGQRVKTTTTDLYSALMITRSEAMKRNASVSLSRNSTWSQGWTVTLADGTIVQTATIPDSVTLTEIGGMTSISYSWTGRPATASVGANFVISASGITARCITLSLSGLPQTKVDSDGNAANGC